MNQITLKIPYASCLCTFYNNGKANVMLIDGVRVDPKHQRRGIGTALMRKAIDLARQESVDSVELAVNEDNLAAIKLYEKVGFRKTLKDYYRILL